MKAILFLLILISGFLQAQNDTISTIEKAKIFALDNSIFKKDSYWRGADGAATIELSGGRVLWLFSDTFIDQDGTGKRANSKTMIRNSIGVQDSSSLKSKLTYYFKGTRQKPDDYFKVSGENWFWAGHGILIRDKLVIFLIEETSTDSGPGFEAVGWYIAIVDNPSDNPNEWNIKYVKGSETFGVVVGSSAVLKDENHVYAFGVKEPATHETYLLRFDKNKLLNGNISELEWWIDNSWTDEVYEEPKSATLFIGQTEFSVHYDKELDKYVQIQTYGFGRASIGYRLADELHGPWSESVLIYTPPLKEEKEFVYSANAHPELESDGLIITYNINNGDFGRLINNEEIYFPKIINLKSKINQ
jgi:hypothetical protein